MTTMHRYITNLKNLVARLSGLDLLTNNFSTVLITNTLYLVWLFFVMNRPIAYVFFVLELAVMILSLLFIINNFKRKYQLIGGPYSMRSIVDIFITTVNEKPKIVEQTLKATIRIKHPNKRVYILDDGKSPITQKLAEKYGATYLSRDDTEIYKDKAHNLNYGLHNSYGSFILVLDADQVPKDTILDDLLGFFTDEKVAMVTTRQSFNVPKDDFNHENLFYDYMQVGSNNQNVGISCGSGVIYRRAALTHIGGFQTWNIVEDLYTSYVLNSNGYKSVYVPQAYTIGDAPTDLAVVYKQRGVWAQDTLRMFIWKNPLFNIRLPLRNRLHYFAIGYSYVVSGVVFPLLFLLNLYSIWFNDPILTTGREWYLFFKLPAFYTNLAMFILLAQGPASVRVWASLFPVYSVAFLKALLYKKPRYKATKKGVKPKTNILAILPHSMLVLTGALGVFYYLVRWGLTWTLIADSFWLGVMIYWFGPFILFGLSLRKKL